MQLLNNLETKKVANLFFAGQVNGTSGYEEAACQGLIAGINANQKIKGLEPLVLKRNEAYTGVLIDDLITKGVKDPYRMLTSRAEFRLLLRHDNSEQRLLKYGYEIGLISEDRYQSFLQKEQNKNEVIKILKDLYYTPKQEINDYLSKNNKSILNEKINGYDFLKRPEIDFNDLETLYQLMYPESSSIKQAFALLDDDSKEQLLIQIRYEGYILKEYKVAQKMLQMENRKIPDDINYDEIKNIASEARDKLKKVLPQTISQASRISGVNPSDISILLVYLESRKS